MSRNCTSIQPLTVRQVVDLLNGNLPNQLQNLGHLEVTSFAHELCDVLPGSIFFACSAQDFSDNFFSNVYYCPPEVVGRAIEGGAVACVVRKTWLEANSVGFSRYKEFLVVVDDALKAYQRVASFLRGKWGGTTVGITGSAGKTTTKDLILHTLRCAEVAAIGTKGNRNNGLGVPETIFGLYRSRELEVLVVEMGMSTRGPEIERLCQVSRPLLGCVLNVLPVHIGNLGSIEMIYESKLQLIRGISDDGTAVLNRDDDRVWNMRHHAPSRYLSFGLLNRPGFCGGSLI
jgi:UDP-N-acetylmuramyl pentapeptide synthase